MPAPQVPNTPDLDQGTSLTLLQRLRQNEADAWSVMVQLYTPLIRRWGTRAGIAGPDLDDLTQEVFRVATTRVSDFRRDRPGDSFRGWLHGITRNFVFKFSEKRARLPQAAGGTDAQLRLQGLPDPDMDTSLDEVADERQALFRRALELVRGQFEEKTWQAFWRTVIDGSSPEDVATELHLSAAAVRKHKSRVLQRLRSEFAELID
jgi:RNA polymerase sigma-70 factor (ECF subfamily)